MSDQKLASPITAQINVTAKLNADGISILAGDGSVGLDRLQLRLTVGQRRWVVQYQEIKDNCGSATDPTGKVRVRTSLRAVEGMPSAVLIEHTLENLSDEPRWVSDLTTGQCASEWGVKLGPGSWLGWDYRYCHTDNVRTERFPFCSMESPYVRIIPVQRTQLGMNQDQPFPAIYLLNQATRDGVVIGAAAAELTRHGFEISRAQSSDKSIFETFWIHHELTQSGGIEIALHSSVTLDATFVQVVRGVHPQNAYEGYLKFLSARHSFRGPRSPMLTEALHCTWNYGVYEKQFEKELLRTAEFIAGNLPGIKWFLMDAGYVKRYGKGATTQNFLDRFYPDPDAAVDPEKFPRGIRHFSDAVRSLGLRPGIWWTPTVCLDSKLYHDHPDWFLRDATGGPYRISEANGFLDLTVSGAADYLDRTLAHIIGRWGFDAVKVDFWSQQFEDQSGRLRDVRRSALQARKLFFETIRRYLPPDGLFITCVATGMGNPFSGIYADAYRNTIDIGIGDWQLQQLNCAWTLPTVLNPGRQTWLVDQDSAGINLSCPDNENFFRLSWCWITMGMHEIGGRLEELPPKWVSAMRKFTDRCDRGYAVRCPDERAFTGVPLPECLFVDFPQESLTRKGGVRQSVAMFNWDDVPRMISVRRVDLGHSGGAVTVEDFWTGQRSRWDDEFATVRLEGRSAMLWDVLA